MSVPVYIGVLGFLTAAVLGGCIAAYAFYLIVCKLWPWLTLQAFELSLRTRWGQRRAIRRFDKLQTYSPYRLRFWRAWLEYRQEKADAAYAPLVLEHVKTTVERWEQEHPPKRFKRPDPNLKIYQER